MVPTFPLEQTTKYDEVFSSWAQRAYFVPVMLPAGVPSVSNPYERAGAFGSVGQFVNPKAEQ